MWLSNIFEVARHGLTFNVFHHHIQHIILLDLLLDEILILENIRMRKDILDHLILI